MTYFPNPWQYTSAHSFVAWEQHFVRPPTAPQKENFSRIFNQCCMGVGAM